MDAEREDLMARLHAGRNALGAALDGIADNQEGRKPAGGGWSILECVEHLALAEEYLLSRLQAAKRADRAHENRVREARIMERAADRTRRVEAPAMSHPHGRIESLTEALKRFDSARAQTVRFLEGFDGDLRCWITDHPLIPGPVNCYEILLMMAAHPARHAQQIQDIRNA